MRTAATTAATKGIRSKFEAEVGGTTKLPAENSGAFIHTANSFLRVSYASAAAATSAAAAARTRKLPKRSREETCARERQKRRKTERKRETRTRNQILSFSREGFQVEISRGTKSKLVFVHYSLVRLHRRHRRCRRRRRRST